jgi:serine/threonine-protein kinase
LKPDNLFLSITKRKSAAVIVKVLDFGIAKLLAESAGKTTTSVGTPLWMAPEQAQATELVAPATDLWSVGLIAFYMLTGQTFWRTGHQDDANTMAILAEILFAELPPASHRAVELGYLGPLPAGFDEFFGKCVCRDPLDRFLDAKELAAAIEIMIPEATPLTPSLLPQALNAPPSKPDFTTSPTEMQLPLSSSIKAARTAASHVAPATGVVTDTNAISPTPLQVTPSEIPQKRGFGVVALVLILALGVIAGLVGTRYLRDRPANVGATTSGSQISAVASATVAPPPPAAAPELRCPPGTGLIAGGSTRDPVTK